MSIDYNLEQRLKRLESWSLVELPSTIKHLRQILDQLVGEIDAGRRRYGALEQRLSNLEAQTGSPGCRACTEGIHARIDELADRLDDAEAVIDAVADLADPFDPEPVQEPSQPRCCVCGDSPETAFTEPLSCPDCGRHPQPAEVVDAISLLMRVVPILDLQVAEHNDTHRLRSAICQYLADKGYPGWREARCPIEEAQRLGDPEELDDPFEPDRPATAEDL